MVVLTPGNNHPAAFEHAFLSRYLGYDLVEGSDLTVRDGMVFLKTLGGLERIDVIIRRVADGWCDALELRPDSLMGVPGLLQAVRDGTIALANGLGSGLIDSPLLRPFFAGISESLGFGPLNYPNQPRAGWARPPATN